LSVTGFSGTHTDGIDPTPGRDIVYK